MTTPTGTNQNDRRHVFISHRGTDDAWAQGLAERLELSGYQVWIDNLDVNPGESIVGAINKGLQISRYVALVMTPEFFAPESEWTAAEWHAALASDPDGHRQRVIPLYVLDCPALPPLLLHLAWIDFRDDNNFKIACDHLMRVLDGKPSRYPARIAGQQITASGTISKETLFAERASVDGRPDVLDETLGSNLLHAMKVPAYVWKAPILPSLGKQHGQEISFPAKERLRNIIRAWQAEQNYQHPFAPAFLRFGNQIWTLYDLSKAGHPLTPIVDSSAVKSERISDLALDRDAQN